jgi:zinc transporter 1/2/3
LEEEHPHEDSKTKTQKLISEWTGIVVLIVALAIHSFLEGLGLGSTEEPLMIFIAIAAHKWADSGLSILYLMRKIEKWWVLAIFLVL